MTVGLESTYLAGNFFVLKLLFLHGAIHIQLNIFSFLKLIQKQTSVLTAIFLSMVNWGWGGVCTLGGEGLCLGLGWD